MHRRDDLRGDLYRERLDAVFDLLGRSGVVPGSGILNIGAVDPAVRERALTEKYEIAALPVGRLSQGDGAAPASAILALKVLPWTREPAPIISNIARLMGPGTRLVVQFHNAMRAGRLLDPRLNPVTGSALRAARRTLNGFRGMENDFVSSLPMAHSERRISELLGSAGLSCEARRAVGFGPFTMLGKHFIADDLGRLIHRGLRDFTAQSAPWMERFCSYIILLARKDG